MNRVRINKELALELWEFCKNSTKWEPIIEKFQKTHPSDSVPQHIQFLTQMKMIRGHMFWDCVSCASKESLLELLERVILDERGFIVYIRDDGHVSNFRQQSSTVLERTLPNPNEIDIIRYALSVVLEDFFTIEIVQKCEMSKPDVSNLKAMKRAVSLDKALEIVSKLDASEKFVQLMTKLMEKKLQMMK